MAQAGVHVRQADRGRSLSDYWPLVSLILVSALAALAIMAGSGQTAMRGVMHAYMGVFLIFFALLKVFDLEGFKGGFAMYDLIAMRNSAWGYVYPFIELALPRDRHVPRIVSGDLLKLPQLTRERDAPATGHRRAHFA